MSGRPATGCRALPVVQDFDLVGGDPDRATLRTGVAYDVRHALPDHPGEQLTTVLGHLVDGGRQVRLDPGRLQGRPRRHQLTSEAELAIPRDSRSYVGQRRP